MKIVHHPGLTFGSATLNRFHPFEFNRAEIALGLLRDQLGEKLERMLYQPSRRLELGDLHLVHSKQYLDSLSLNSVVARVIEVPFLKWCPRRWLDVWFREPAAWSVACTVEAVRFALGDGFAMSLGGGFHHAKRGGGEGFCLVSDIAYSVELLRQEKALKTDDSWVYIDLDVHQGNGVSDYYGDDSRVTILDAYNRHIYPVYGTQLQDQVDLAIELDWDCDDAEYLGKLKSGLEHLEERLARARLIIYNAGTDVFSGDRLGGLKLSREGIRTRDVMILETARQHGVPLVALASGGYSEMSATLLSDLALSAYRVFEEQKS